MNAVWIDIPEEILEERRRNGQDKKDELWEGVLHLVPPPSPRHNRVAFELTKVLEKLGPSRGLVAHSDPTGIYAPHDQPTKSWRVPDAALARPEQESERGLEGAVLAVEVLSPDDESFQKLPFYARVGLSEVWIIDPLTREPMIFTLVDDAWVAVSPVDGRHSSPLLGVELSVIDGPQLRITGDGHVFDL